MSNDIVNNPPKVFISYSHDTPNHKKWVSEFSSRLMENQVAVILDQWDLSPGDDVPKFMEKSVLEADRVLVICTEPYVHKANEGMGGVGYEAMIVTGQLISNLGTKKFIPVIRQVGKDILLPTALSTRCYINLSDDNIYEEEFNKLVNELRNKPKNKPLFGKSPLAVTPLGNEIPLDNTFNDPIPSITNSTGDVLKIYNTALSIVRKGDVVAWRKIIREAKQITAEETNKWRANNESKNLTRDILFEFVASGVLPNAPLIVIALAGVESGRAGFNNQISILDAIINPYDWNRSGRVILADFPNTIGFVYHLLHGAMCVSTSQIDVAVNFLNTPIRRNNYPDSLPVIKNYELTGWPDALDGNSTASWKFIKNLPNTYPWLNEIYGNSSDYRSYLCAYYLLMSICEFINEINQWGDSRLKIDEKLRLEVPLSFFDEEHEVLKKAYQLLLNDHSKIANIWRDAGISDNKVKELWKYWILQSENWFSGADKYRNKDKIIHRNLIDDLRIT